MTEVYKSHFGNASSSTHPYGWYAAEIVQIAREEVASLMNAEPDEIVFTSGATEANNLAILGVARRASQKKRRDLLTVESEHDAVLDPVKELEAEGFNPILLPLLRDRKVYGLVEEESFRNAVSDKTLLCSVMLANNEIGVIQDIKQFASIAQEHGAVFHTDATQAVGKMPVDVKDLGVDLLSCTAHKMYGPKGVGALYIRKGERRPLMKPLVFGGGHEKALRSGTLNVPGIVGFGVACRIARAHLEEDMKRIKTLTARLLAKLQCSLRDVEVNGCLEPRLPGNLNIHIKGIDTVRLLGLTNTKVAYSTTAACQSDSTSPSHVLAALGLSNSEQLSSIRLGVGRFTTEEEIDQASDILTQAVVKLRK